MYTLEHPDGALRLFSEGAVSGRGELLLSGGGFYFGEISYYYSVGGLVVVEGVGDGEFVPYRVEGGEDTPLPKEDVAILYTGLLSSPWAVDSIYASHEYGRSNAPYPVWGRFVSFANLLISHQNLGRAVACIEPKYLVKLLDIVGGAKGLPTRGNIRGALTLLGLAFPELEGLKGEGMKAIATFLLDTGVATYCGNVTHRPDDILEAERADRGFLAGWRPNQYFFGRKTGVIDRMLKEYSLGPANRMTMHSCRVLLRRCRTHYYTEEMLEWLWVSEPEHAHHCTKGFETSEVVLTAQRRISLGEVKGVTPLFEAIRYNKNYFQELVATINLEGLATSSSAEEETCPGVGQASGSAGLGVGSTVERRATQLLSRIVGTEVATVLIRARMQLFARDGAGTAPALAWVINAFDLEFAISGRPKIPEPRLMSYATVTVWHLSAEIALAECDGWYVEVDGNALHRALCSGGYVVGTTELSSRAGYGHYVVGSRAHLRLGALEHSYDVGNPIELAPMLEMAGWSASGGRTVPCEEGGGFGEPASTGTSTEQ